MSQPSDPEAVSEQEAEALIERLQQDALSAQDKVVITKVIRSYLYLALMVQQTGVKLKQVRQFLFGSFKKKDQGQNGVTDTVKGDNAHEAVAHPET